MRHVLLSCAASLLVLGSARANAAPPTSPVQPALPVRVYVYERGGLSGLYCATAAGVLAEGAACEFPKRLTLQIAKKRHVLTRKIEKRDGGDATFEVVRYRLPALRNVPLLVVTSPRGTGVWTGVLASRIGPNAERMPVQPPRLDANSSGIEPIGTATVEAPTPRSAKGGKVTFVTEGTSRTWEALSYTPSVVLGTFDLDGDGHTELILVGTDDGGGHVGAYELDASEKWPSTSFVIAGGVN